MNNTKFVNKTIICSVIFLCAFGAHAASLPPDPDNAALLYYQAFLVLPEPDYITNRLVYNTTEKIYKYLKGAKLDPDPEKEIKEIEKIIHELELRDKGISPDPNKKLYPFERIIYPSKPLKVQGFGEIDLLKGTIEHYKEMKGVDPNKVIRKYLNKCGQSIALAQAASEIQNCDWGIRYSQGLSFNLPQMVEIRELRIILHADAMRLAADGNYRAALERCIMKRRIAHHVGNDVYILYAVSKSVDGSTLKCIQHILGYMKPDEETLIWLKNQLSAESEESMSPAKALKIDFELTVQSLRMDTDTLEKLSQALQIKEEIKGLVKDESFQNDEDSKEKKSLSDEEIIALAKKPYADFLNSALITMKSEMSYEQKYKKIQSLTNKLKDEYDGHSAAFKQEILIHPEKMLTFSIVMACSETVLKSYNLYIRNNSHFNAFIAAIDIYLVQAKTGKLPKTLPDGLPKDPYTGKDFIYEITDEGFALRCKGENFQGRGKRMLEFKVKK